MSDDREAWVQGPEGRGKLDVLLELGGAKAIAAERDELRRRIQAVLDYVATLECSNCDHVHEEGDCGAVIPDGRACRCTWGPPDVTEEVRKLLAEPGRPAQPASDPPPMLLLKIELVQIRGPIPVLKSNFGGEETS